VLRRDLSLASTVAAVTMWSAELATGQINAAETTATAASNHLALTRPP
jgi:hypothetical protein